MLLAKKKKTLQSQCERRKVHNVLFNELIGNIDQLISHVSNVLLVECVKLHSTKLDLK